MGSGPTYVTKVLNRARGLRFAAAMFAAIGLCRLASASEPAVRSHAEELYLQLGSVGLDAGLVFQVRGASIERSAIHISLEDGTIAFTQDVLGHVTGAFFEGEGEILLAPPNEVERESMSV